MIVGRRAEAVLPGIALAGISLVVPVGLAGDFASTSRTGTMRRATEQAAPGIDDTGLRARAAEAANCAGSTAPILGRSPTSSSDQLPARPDVPLPGWPGRGGWYTLRFTAGSFTVNASWPEPLRPCRAYLLMMATPIRASGSGGGRRKPDATARVAVAASAG